MVKKTYILLLTILLFVSFIGCKKETGKIHLEITDWQFRQTGDSTWLQAVVPGCVHTDLLKNGLIEDPFFGDNEKKLQWIEKEDWEYKSTFEIQKSFLNHDLIELVFEGLDTYAAVWLNDSLVLNADNMFRAWTVECNKLLKPGKNELLIKFTSPLLMDSLKASTLPYQLPDNRAFSRKTPYQYGWDWGPRFVTSGIWKPVYFRSWNNARIADVQVVQNDLKPDKATLAANIEIQSVREQDCMIRIEDYGNNTVLTEKKVHLEKGNNEINVTFQITNPLLWYPNGMGDQNLYTLDCIMQTGSTKDTITRTIGLRTVVLVRDKDTIGESFYFRVNGIPVFMKGANYIPQDNFPSRVPDEKYRQTIQSAVDANMNMLRVWGGGIYEKDIFYDLCDEMGILVWQDFMFACNMYPGDPAFIENVRQEAIYQVKRLRNHPSMAIWCGNNEVDEGWHNWGWQKALNYSASDSTEVWNSYLKIFEKILPEVVSLYSPYIAYTPSSPRIGWGHKEAMTEGDMHYWGVWWGEEPFEVYEQKVGRFMSEYGFQGFPDVRTLSSCLNPDDLHLASEALQNHQKHPRGMELINTYMAREYKVPDSFEDYVYVSQLVQAYGIRKAIEAHRRAMPRCMGTLYWQLNDCWQVISWSSVDYNNRWKALHYFVRDAYQDLLISFEKKKDEVEVYIISDLQKEVPALLDVKIADFSGNVIWGSENKITINPNSSESYLKTGIKNFSLNDHLLIAGLISGDSVIAQNLYYFAPTKQLKLPEPHISTKITATDVGYIIELTSDKLAKNVFLNNEEECFFNDNFFDLVPGKAKRIICKTNIGFADFENRLKITTIQNIYK